MGTSQSCMKQDAIQNVVNQAPEGNTSADGSHPNLPRLENPALAKEPIITQVNRRHKGARLPKQRELMVAGLQVRQQQGESIAYLLNSLPYGSIIQVESNTHLIVAQPVRRLQLSIYQNHLGNVQIATVTSQEGIVPPKITNGQILVTVNGKSIKSVDQAVELLSQPEKLLLVIAEAPLDKKDRLQMKGTIRVVDSVLTRQDIRRSNSSLLSSPRDQEEEKEEREDRHRRRRRKHKRRGSGSSHGSHSSSKSHGSSRSHGSHRSSSKPKSTTSLRNQDKVIPTESIRRHSNSSSSMSSSNIADSRGGGDKIFVAKGGKSSMDGAASNGTNPTADSSDSDTKKKENIMLNTTMDTANTTVISYDEDGQEDHSFMVHSPTIISPSSSVASPTTPARQTLSPTSAAAAIVTPASKASLEHVSKIASYDDEEEGGHPLLFQTNSSDSDADSRPEARARAALKTTGEDDDEEEAESSRVQKVLSDLEDYLEETMMELAFVMIEIEDIQSKHSKPIGDVKSSPSKDRMTCDKLEALEKDLRLKMFDILEARQGVLQKQGIQHQQPSLALPTIDEQPKAGTLEASLSPKQATSPSSSQLKPPPSPPPKLSLSPSNNTKSIKDLEQQLFEMQSANKALKQELAHKDSQLNEFQALEQQAQQNKVSETRVQ